MLGSGKRNNDVKDTAYAGWPCKSKGQSRNECNNLCPEVIIICMLHLGESGIIITG